MHAAYSAQSGCSSSVEYARCIFHRRRETENRGRGAGLDFKMCALPAQFPAVLCAVRRWHDDAAGLPFSA